METINLIRFILGVLFISAGTLTFILEILGVYRLHFILNRMHFAGTGDTMALAFIIIGSAIMYGHDYACAKFLLVLVFFWFTSPVSSHLISRLVEHTEEDLSKHCKVYDLEESKAIIAGKEETK